MYRQDRHDGMQAGSFRGPDPTTGGHRQDQHQTQIRLHLRQSGNTRQAPGWQLVDTRSVFYYNIYPSWIIFQLGEKLKWTL